MARGTLFSYQPSELTLSVYHADLIPTKLQFLSQDSAKGILTNESLTKITKYAGFRPSSSWPLSSSDTRSSDLIPVAIGSIFNRRIRGVKQVPRSEKGDSRVLFLGLER